MSGKLANGLGLQCFTHKYPSEISPMSYIVTNLNCLINSKKIPFTNYRPHIYSREYENVFKKHFIITCTTCITLCDSGQKELEFCSGYLGT